MTACLDLNICRRMNIYFEKMSEDSGKKYRGFHKRAIIFISIILKRYNTMLFRYCLQENDNIWHIQVSSIFKT